ncbi:hypothetical protein GS501_01680 [Saccharibacter sp. 17.LH.SD]|uniref:hypothetical protein n=1 Tax=Saccharibacter sp. 17.LH.SD TaxID=2689393 RepID=UPI00137116B7|nr:hypothetical protein [Saccharibacter sp. 17.LH.SD]MXV43765.1 hypothetical protein [Saccharibacter sp. 17.LH.SD]
MKRPWLTLCLTALIFFITGVGIYREANHRLNQALARFQENLPVGSQFTYQDASPALLVRGLSLRNVTFRYHDITFHAHHIRLGHPQILSDGHISLASVLITKATYENPTLKFTFSKGVLRHLLVPYAVNAHPNSHATDDHNVPTAFMTFNLDDMSAIRFGRMHVEGLETFFISHPTILNPNLSLSHLHIGTFTFEGYGLGSQTYANIQHFTAKLDIASPLVASLFSGKLSFLFPALNLSETPRLPVSITLDEFNAHQGTMHWLQHPFRSDASLSEQFHNNPFQTIWTSPGTLGFNGLSLKLSNATDTSHFQIDHFVMTRRHENEVLRTEGEFQGLHARLTNHHLFPLPFSGQQSVIRFSQTNQEEYDNWESVLTLRFIVPKTGLLSFNSHYRMPMSLPALIHEPSDNHLLQKIIFDDSTLSIKGDHLLDCLFFFTHPNLLKDNLAMSREKAVQDLGTITETHPLLTPLSDYLLKPQNRTFSITFGDLSLYDILNLPFSEPVDVLLDSAHMTAAHVQ